MQGGYRDAWRKMKFLLGCARAAQRAQQKVLQLLPEDLAAQRAQQKVLQLLPEDPEGPPVITVASALQAGFVMLAWLWLAMGLVAALSHGA